jgi:hypothetical protein|tara:strand:+ start:75 stop:236 length:162 start_codon:yes stop_codon:yes gene_type:complete
MALPKHYFDVDLVQFPKIFSGGYSIGETPDPIPNSEVKSYCADGTARVTSVGE